MALPSRFISTCLTRRRSLRKIRSSGTSAATARPLASARGVTALTVSFVTSGDRETISIDRSTRPDSILEMSRISLISSSRCVALVLDHGQLLGLLVVQVPGHPHQEQAREPENGVERRPQLVAHAGQEQAFQAVQLDEPLVGRGQLPGAFVDAALERFIELADLRLGLLALVDVPDDDQVRRPPLVRDPGRVHLGVDAGVRSSS